MSRIEMVRCDLESCDNASPNGTSGFGTTYFEGRLYDFCSTAHSQKWEDELQKLDPAAKPKRKAKA